MTNLCFITVALMMPAYCGCAASLLALDPDEADQKLGIPGSGEPRYGSPGAYEHMIRGEFLAAGGDREGAVTEFKAAIKTDPDDFYLRGRLAELLIELEKFEAAKKNIERILRRDWGSETGWLTLAKYYKAKGNEKEAVKVARKAIRVEPSEARAAMWLSSHYHENSEFEKAAEILNRIVYTDPFLSEARLLLAKTYLALERPARGIEQLEAFSKLRPDRADIVEKRAMLAFDQGDRSGAVDLLELVLARDPTNVKARTRLIRLYIELESYPHATRNLASLPPIPPDDIEGVVERAGSYASAQQVFFARAMLAQFSARHPESVKLRLGLARVELALGRLESAEMLVEGVGDGLTAAELKERDEVLVDIESWPSMVGGK